MQIHGCQGPPQPPSPSRGVEQKIKIKINSGKLRHRSADISSSNLPANSSALPTILRRFLRFCGCSCLKDFDAFGVSEIELISLTSQPAARMVLGNMRPA